MYALRKDISLLGLSPVLDLLFILFQNNLAVATTDTFYSLSSIP